MLSSSPRPRTFRNAAAGQPGLLLAREQTCREAVAPFDLAEEGLAVVGVPDRARADREHTFSAELFELAAVVREDVSDPRDWERQQLAPLVDALAETRDLQAPRDLVNAAVVDVRDEQPGRVGAEVDNAHTHRDQA